MPVIDAAVAERARKIALSQSGDSPPRRDNRPAINEDQSGREKSLDTPASLPPYLHHQSLRTGGVLFLVTSLLGLVWYIDDRIPGGEIREVM
jgi:hypothetical protein